ncbi:ABC transporter permease [Pseudonocardia acaciae]|uniref:ABC transporter permease n=1 Tax=Pseudonocardia acaciae TaxID=551276 RepID=UPI00055FD56C|nr:ABC transporter permease [Pseudonocardia acaciae]
MSRALESSRRPRPAGSERPPAARRPRVPDPVLTVAVVAVVLAAAEAVARSGAVSRLILPAPSEVFAALVGGIRDGSFLDATWDTVWPTVVGFVLSSVVAIATGGLLGSLPRLESVLMPLVYAIQATPKVAIAPLVILWFGFDAPGKIVVVGIVTFFPVVVNTLAGMRIREREKAELMRAMGATKMQVFRYIRLPNALPYIFAGLHVGIIFSLIGAVVAEFVGSRAGLGYLLVQQKALFDVAGVFASIVLLMVIGIVFNRIMVIAERRIVFWAEDTTGTPI